MHTAGALVFDDVVAVHQVEEFGSGKQTDQRRGDRNAIQHIDGIEGAPHDAGRAHPDGAKKKADESRK